MAAPTGIACWLRRARTALPAALAACLLAPTALAAGAADPEPAAELNPAGQAVAERAVLRRWDLGGEGVSWAGGLRTPAALTLPVPCPAPTRFAPKESDTVVNGAARSIWDTPGVRIDTHTSVVATPRMAKLGWQRWARPLYADCLRRAILEASGPGTRTVTVSRLQFPNVGSFTAAYRVVVEGADGSRRFLDSILVASGRARISLTVTAEYELEQVVTHAEVVFAATLARRATLAAR